MLILQLTECESVFVAAAQYEIWRFLQQDLPHTREILGRGGHLNQISQRKLHSASGVLFVHTTRTRERREKPGYSSTSRMFCPTRLPTLVNNNFMRLPRSLNCHRALKPECYF